MKHILVLILLSLLPGCTLFSVRQSEKPQPPKIDVVARAVNNTVAIIDDVGDLICSGVAAEDFILTAEHCLLGASKVRYKGTDHPFVISLTWVEKDLAILQPVGKRLRDYVPLAPQEPVLGQKAVWLGYPLGEELILSTGVVGRPKGSNGMLILSGQVLPGHSGGPVFDETGKLIGIISSTMALPGAYLPQFLPIGYAVHWDTIKEALAALD